MPKGLQSDFNRLEQILQELNERDADVEEGLRKFKEGATLIKALRSQLKKAENEFNAIKADLESSTNDRGGEIDSADAEKEIPF